MISSSRGRCGRRGALVAALILMTSTTHLASQSAAEPSPHGIGLGAGWERLATRDDQVSPMRYHGDAWPLEMAYRYDGHRFHHLVTASYGATRLSSAITADDRHRSRVQEHRLRHHMTLQVATFSPQGSDLGVGLIFEAAIRERSHRYVAFADEEFIRSLFTLGPLVRGTLAPTDRIQLEGWVGVPLVAVVAASPYGVKGTLETRFEPPGGFTRLQPGVAARWRLSRWMTAQASVEARYTRVREPAPARDLQRLVALHLLWTP